MYKSVDASPPAVNLVASNPSGRGHILSPDLFSYVSWMENVLLSYTYMQLADVILTFPGMGSFASRVGRPSSADGWGGLLSYMSDGAMLHLLLCNRLPVCSLYRVTRPHGRWLVLYAQRDEFYYIPYISRGFSVQAQTTN